MLYPLRDPWRANARVVTSVSQSYTQNVQSTEPKLNSSLDLPKIFSKTRTRRRAHTDPCATAASLPQTAIGISQDQLAKSHDEYRLVILDPEKATPNTARRAPRVGCAIGTAGSRHSARCAERCTRRALKGLGLTTVAPSFPLHVGSYLDSSMCA